MAEADTVVKLTLGASADSQFINFPSRKSAELFTSLAQGSEHKSGKRYTAEVVANVTVRNSEGVSTELMNLELSDVWDLNVRRQLGLANHI